MKLNKLNKNVIPAINSGKIKPVAAIFKGIDATQEAFIVGNSSTLNKLTPQQFKRINEGFTIGFASFALFQPIKADILMLELSDFWHTDTGLATLDAVKSRYLHDSKVLLKDLAKDEAQAAIDFANLTKTNDNIYFTPDVFFGGNEPAKVRAQYRQYFSQFANSDKIEFLPRKRASITMALCLLLLAGFKKIHFVACELAHSKYFNGYEGAGVHLTEDKRYGLPVSEVIRQIIPAEVYSYGGRLARFGICKDLNL